MVPDEAGFEQLTATATVPQEGSVHHAQHYQLQFHENPIKSSLKTHEPIFHGHENGDSPFHGLSQTHEFTMKFEAV